MKRYFGLFFLLFFFFSLWTAAMDEAAAEALPEKLLRLRVVAESDEEARQTEKLLVRDAVLAALGPRLADCGGLPSAEAVTAEALPDLAAAAGEALRAAGRETSVTLRLGKTACPLRSYGGFTLPAGEYESLTVTLGAGEGRNWWCVVFPPLCLAAAGEEEADAWAVFSPGEKRLLTSGGAEVRFRALELLKKLRSLFSGG